MNEAIQSLLARAATVIHAGAKIMAREYESSAELSPGSAVARPGAWEGGHVVATRHGRFRGRPDLEDTIAWRGIPYAAPPTGELRWRPPHEPVAMSGIRNADRFGSAATQYVPLTGILIGSEDCLHLNVWRPADGERGLPVYVFIHGGGNAIGAANMVPDYYGHALASRERLVVVTINYRLGALGWFRLPGGGSGIEGSGNFGTLDIIAALRWVKENAEAFGGDPRRVTVAGESAGAMNLLSLMTSPLAAGLFEGAVVESGLQHHATREESEAAALNLLATFLKADRRAPTMEAALELAASMEHEEAMDYLRFKPAKAIVERLVVGANGMSKWPTVIGDGLVLARDAQAALARGEAAFRVPTVIGANREEVKLFLYFDRKIDPKSGLFRAIAKYGSERWRADGVHEIAEGLVSARPGPGSAPVPPVYVYRFDWGSVDEKGESPFPGVWGERLGAFHSLEVPFFLGTATINGAFLTGNLFTLMNRPGGKALSSGIMSRIGAFARSGDPNAVPASGEAWPSWTRRSPGGGEGLIFGGSSAEASIGTLDENFTAAEVEAKMREELPKGLHSRVKAWLGWK